MDKKQINLQIYCRQRIPDMYNIGQWKQTWSCSMGLSEHDAIQSQRCTLSFNHCVWRDAFEWHYLWTSPTKDAPKRALKRWLSLPIEKQKNATKRTVKFRSWDGNLDRWIHKLRGRRDWFSLTVDGNYYDVACGNFPTSINVVAPMRSNSERHQDVSQTTAVDMFDLYNIRIGFRTVI